LEDNWHCGLDAAVQYCVRLIYCVGVVVVSRLSANMAMATARIVELKIAAGCNSNVLLSIYCIGDGRCVDACAQVEPPDLLTGDWARNLELAVLLLIEQRYRLTNCRSGSKKSCNGIDKRLTPQRDGCRILISQGHNRHEKDGMRMTAPSPQRTADSKAATAPKTRRQAFSPSLDCRRKLPQCELEMKPSDLGSPTLSLGRGGGARVAAAIRRAADDCGSCWR
jgi:hypothetical protein